MSASAPKIRAVDSFDLPVLAALHAACFTAPWDQRWTEQSFAEILAMPGAGALIMALGAEPIGFAVARVALDEAELLLIGVVPQYRRAGYAGALLERLLAELAAAGVTRIVLEVAESNPSAVAFYRKTMFLPVGRRAGYYRAPGRNAAPVDALLMARPLAPGGAGG